MKPNDRFAYVRKKKSKIAKFRSRCSDVGFGFLQARIYATERTWLPTAFYRLCVIVPRGGRIE